MLSTRVQLNELSTKWRGADAAFPEFNQTTVHTDLMFAGLRAIDEKLDLIIVRLDALENQLEG